MLKVLLHCSSPSPSPALLEYKLFAVMLPWPGDLPLGASCVGTSTTLLPALGQHRAALVPESSGCAAGHPDPEAGTEVSSTASPVPAVCRLFLFYLCLKCPANVWVASCSVAASWEGGAM